MPWNLGFAGHDNGDDCAGSVLVLTFSSPACPRVPWTQPGIRLSRFNAREPFPPPSEMARRSLHGMLLFAQMCIPAVVDKDTAHFAKSRAAYHLEPARLIATVERWS
jgi:hypothetical protein